MVPQAMRKPIVDRIVTFKLSLATGVRDRMVQFGGTILTYYHSQKVNDGLIGYRP